MAEDTSSLKTETGFSETSVITYETAQCGDLEDQNSNVYFRENLKSHVFVTNNFT